MENETQRQPTGDITTSASRQSRNSGLRSHGESSARHGGRGRGGRWKRSDRVAHEFEQKILDLARVTRVTAGGKRMSFRCALVIGDKKGKVGMGLAKGGDVQIAIEKAYKQAKKRVFKVPLSNGTIPHPVWLKYGSAVVLLKPAPKGTGLKAGGAVRMVLEFAGVSNAVSKIINSSNKINIAKAAIQALKQLRTVKEAAHQSLEADASAQMVEPSATNDTVVKTVAH